jgi:hypothetical protein
MEYVPLHSLRVQWNKTYSTIALFVFSINPIPECFSDESISLFWYYIKQIINVFSCNGKNIFIWWKMKCSIPLGCRLVEWNIPSFTSWKYSYHCTHKHSLFVYYLLLDISSYKTPNLVPRLFPLVKQRRGNKRKSLGTRLQDPFFC